MRTSGPVVVVIFIPNRIQQYNRVCMTNITNNRVIIDIVMWFCWWPPEKPWAYQAGSHSQKQVSMTWLITSHRILWDVITYPYLGYLDLAPKSLYILCGIWNAISCDIGKCTPPWMFLPLDIPSEYRPEHVTFGLLCVIFKFPSRIFCRRVPGFATDCHCGVWCRGLTTCLLYVGPPLEF